MAGHLYISDKILMQMSTNAYGLTADRGWKLVISDTHEVAISTM